MDEIHIVWGIGHGPTETAAYDAALASANVHNYNLVAVSSVIPADTTVSRVGTAPELGPIGGRLTVVEGATTVAGPGRGGAALAWTTGEGPGLFYESAGPTDVETVEARVREGIEAGIDLRGWSVGDVSVESVSAAAESGEYVGVAVLAIYGRAEPIL